MGRSDPLDESYRVNGTPEVSPTEPGEKYGETANGYAASYYPKVETNGVGVVLAVLPRIQPSPDGPAPTHAAPVPTSSVTVTLEPANESKMLAATAATRIDMPPRAPAHPDLDSGEAELALAGLNGEDDSAQAALTQPGNLEPEHAANAPSPSGSVLAGVMPIDRAALARAVDEFFARVDQLGEELGDTWTEGRLAPVLTAAALSTAAYAFARHRLRRSLRAGAATDDNPRDQEWAWFTDCAILPPWDKR
jgi:hypothetical protein